MLSVKRLFWPVTLFVFGMLALLAGWRLPLNMGLQAPGLGERALASDAAVAASSGSLVPGLAMLPTIAILAGGLSAVLAFGLMVLRLLDLRRDLRRSNEALQSVQSLLAAAPLAFLAWSRERGVLLWSDSAERVFGVERDQALGRPLLASMFPLRDAVEEALQHADAAFALQVGLRNERSEHLQLSVSASYMSAEARDGPTIAAVIEDLTPHRLREERRLDAVRAQRDALVREVHHRIKNHLQGIAGLLRQHLAGKPLLKPLLEAATAQVLSIAAVHGLQGETQSGVLNLRSMVARIAASISGIMHVPIVLGESCTGLEGMSLSEEEAVPVAMVLNEMLMNAVKHRVNGIQDGLVHVGATRSDDGVAIRIENQGFLPPRFDFARGAHLGTGLGLVRSLLPSQGVTLGIQEEGDRVVATLSIGPPHLLFGDGFVTEAAA